MRDVFDAHYRKYFREMYVFVYQQVHSQEVSMELTQDVFVALYQRMLEDNNIEKIRPWLYGVARYKILGRKKEAENTTPLEEENDITNSITTDDVERELTRRAVRHWIETQLHQENFQILLLYLQGFSNRELSEMFSLSEVVIKKRLQRTREQTLAYFRKNHGES